MSTQSERPAAAFPIAPPEREAPPPPPPGQPDLRLEEIEEKHVPKDRNVFDK